MNVEQAGQHLRYMITGLLHVGKLRRGDPLPSIRAAAGEMGADHRVVASAYRALAAEGLVEIRPGSGVYLASEPAGAARGETTEGWLGRMLLEGWSRGVSRAGVGEMVQRAAGAAVRCALVESNDDHMEALGAELEDDFSLRVRRVPVSPGAGDAAAIPPESLADADFVVTTIFHADVARAAAARAERPCVVLSVSRDFSAEVNRRLGRREVTAVIADPRYSARGMAHLDVTPHRGFVRFVRVDELGAPGQPPLDLESDAVLITRAARRRLGLDDYHLVPSLRYISPESAAELFHAIIAASLRAA